LTAVDPGIDPEFETYDRIMDALVVAVETGVVRVEQVNESLDRVLRLRQGLGTP